MKRIARLVCGILIVLVAGCARGDWIDRTLVTENVTGAWSGGIGSGNTYRYVELQLQQDGPRVKGTVKAFPGEGTVAIEGSVAGDVLTLKDARGSWSGELTVAGDDMSGKVLTSMGARPISLHRASPR